MSRFPMKVSVSFVTNPCKRKGLLLDFFVVAFLLGFLSFVVLKDSDYHNLTQVDYSHDAASAVQ
jgi:hypothetical protein